MAVYLVTYDLKKPGQDYTDILKKIHASDSWARLSESSYAIQTSWTEKQLYDYLKPHLDQNDNLYVIALCRPWTGRGPKDVNDWLERNLPQ